MSDGVRATMEQVEGYLREFGFRTLGSQSDRHHLVIGTISPINHAIESAVQVSRIARVSEVDRLIKTHLPAGFVAAVIKRGSTISVRYGGPNLGHARQVRKMISRALPGRKVNVMRVVLPKR